MLVRCCRSLPLGQFSSDRILNFGHISSHKNIPPTRTSSRQTQDQKPWKVSLDIHFDFKMDKFYSSDTQRRGKRACMVCSIVLPKSVCSITWLMYLDALLSSADPATLHH